MLGEILWLNKTTPRIGGGLVVYAAGERAWCDSPERLEYASLLQAYLYATCSTKSCQLGENDNSLSGEGRRCLSHILISFSLTEESSNQWIL